MSALDGMDAYIEELRSLGAEVHAVEMQAIRDTWFRALERQTAETHPMYRLPIADMLERQWITGETIAEIESSLARFFGFASWPELNEAMEGKRAFPWHRCVRCAAAADIQCDGELGEDGARKTPRKSCDAWLCERCAHEAGPDRHYCDSHYAEAVFLGELE